MINPDSVGRTFKGVEQVTVTQSQIDAFALSLAKMTQALHPLHFLSASPYLNMNQS